MKAPSELYDNQKRNAEARGIPFLISYTEWLEMWLVSGQWSNRGKSAGQYQMCRIGDEGPYSVRNCYIATMEDNQKVTRKFTDEQAKEMHDLYLAGETQRKIGEKFGVHQSTVCKILNGTRRIG